MEYAKKEAQLFDMKAGSFMYVGRYTYGIRHMNVITFGQGASVIIGQFCSIANCTIMLGGEHPTNVISTWPFAHPMFSEEFGSEAQWGKRTKGNVVIGNDVWIGNFATIMSGIKIGNGAVIAANAHVVKDVPDYAIVGGNPAKVIKYRFSDEIITLLNQLAWWNMPEEKIKEFSAILYNHEPTKELLIDLIKKYK